MIFFYNNSLVNNLKAMAYQWIHNPNLYVIIQNPSYATLIHHIREENWSYFTSIPPLSLLLLKTLNNNWHNDQFWQLLLMVLDKEISMVIYKYKIISTLIFSGGLLAINMILQYIYLYNFWIIMGILACNMYWVWFIVQFFYYTYHPFILNIMKLLFFLSLIEYKDLQAFKPYNFYNSIKELMDQGCSMGNIITQHYPHRVTSNKNGTISWIYHTVENNIYDYYHKLDYFFHQLNSYIITMIMISVLLLIINGGLFMINSLKTVAIDPIF